MGWAGLAPKFRRNFTDGVGGVRALVLVAVLFVGLATSSFAQMDMLPQIFRDLPPELQEGLPEQMTFAEYRALNRNVDFFTMFMSIFVPGYGLFQVERPDVAWLVGGARVVGYGMMGTAIGLQWNNFYDLVKEPALSAEDFNRLLRNGFIFGGGVIVAGLSWATDVMLSYHIAKQEKDLVQYAYGIRSAIYGSGRGGSDPASDERNLRNLLEQTGDRMLKDQLLIELPEYARRYPAEEFAGEALYFASLLAAEEHDDPHALRLAVRSGYLFPDGPRAMDAVRLIVRLFERNRSWDVEFESAAKLTDIPGRSFGDADARLLEGIRRLSAIEDPVLAEAALAESQSFLREYTASSLVPQALGLTADLLVRLDREEEAAGYLAALVVGNPESELWPHYSLRLAELYLGPLADEERAAIVLNAIVEGAPDSQEADRAEAMLAE